MGYIPQVYFYSVTQNISTLAAASLSLDPCPLDILLSLWDFWNIKKKKVFFLALQDSPGSSCKLPVLGLESVTSLRTGFLLFEDGIRNQDLIDRHLEGCYWNVVTSRHPQLPGNICM